MATDGLIGMNSIYDRIAYRRSGREGLAVSELSLPDRKATAEISLLYKEVFDGA